MLTSVGSRTSSIPTIELTLVHPATHKPMTWSAPLPRDLKRLIEDLRK